MQEKIKSEGKCLYCSKMFTKGTINRHLATHLSESAGTGQKGQSYLVKVETNKKWGATPFFLSLWIDGGAKLSDLDAFLRSIWLDCCSHMSEFKNPKSQSPKGGELDMQKAMELLGQGKVKEYKKMMEDTSGEIPMSKKVKDIFNKDLILDYDYDFGSTTALTITVVEEYAVKADSKIVLLSRNEPLPVMCALCKQVPAIQICATCMFEGPAVFCNKCAPKHAKKM
jgi:hypothetical protein